MNDEDSELVEKKKSKFWEYIRESIKDDNHIISSTRIQAYLLLSMIYAFVGIYLLIEIVNASIMWSHGKAYIVSNESIIIFSMILAHHIAVLFHKIREHKFKTPKKN